MNPIAWSLSWVSNWKRAFVVASSQKEKKFHIRSIIQGIKELKKLKKISPPLSPLSPKNKKEYEGKDQFFIHYEFVTNRLHPFRNILGSISGSLTILLISSQNCSHRIDLKANLIENHRYSTFTVYLDKKGQYDIWWYF